MSDKHNRDPFANRYPRDDTEGKAESDDENDASTDEQRTSEAESETVQTPETTEEPEASEMAETTEEKQRSEEAVTSDATEASEASETEEIPESSGTSKTSKNEKTQEKSGGGVRDRKNVNMYLPDTLVEELQLRYAELNLEYRRERGEDMPKNQVFYPAVIRAALGESTVREMIDASDEE